MHYCALCCIAKDEDLFLKEWLTYHALIGFEHFIIYDNLSERPIAELLDGWAAPDQVTVIRNPKEMNQGYVYAHCLKHFGKNFKWIGFIDVDEFIRFAPAQEDLADIRIFLSEFEPYAGLGLNWRMFSSGGHVQTPTGAVIGKYTRSFGDDPHIKSIVQPAKTIGCAGPHAFHPLPGTHAVNADHFPIPPGFPFAVPATGRVAINHYFYKSRQCFANKIAKGNPCNLERRMHDFERHLAMADAEDTSLARFAPRVEALLANPAKGLFRPEKPRFSNIGSQPAGCTAHLRAGREMLDQGRTRQAMLHLCYAALHNDQAVDGDPVITLDIWTMRAEIFLLRNDIITSEQCLKQACTCHAGHKTFGLLADLLLRTGKTPQAKAVLEILRTYENHASPDADDGKYLLPQGRAALVEAKTWFRLANENTAPPTPDSGAADTAGTMTDAEKT